MFEKLAGKLLKITHLSAEPVMIFVQLSDGQQITLDLIVSHPWSDCGEIET